MMELAESVHEQQQPLGVKPVGRCPAIENTVSLPARPSTFAEPREKAEVVEPGSPGTVPEAAPHTPACQATATAAAQERDTLATAAAAGLVRAGQHIICTQRHVGKMAGIVHAFTVEVKPYVRRSAIDVSRHCAASSWAEEAEAEEVGALQTMPHFLQAHGVALRRLQDQPNPAVLQLLSVVEPTGANGGFLVAPALYGDTFKPGTLPPTSKALHGMMLQMLQAVVHCHSLGVAVGEGLSQGGFCWADPLCKRLVLAGIAHATVPSSPEAAAAAYAADLRAIGQACLRLVDGATPGTLELPLTLPPPLQALVLTLLSAEKSGPTSSELFDVAALLRLHEATSSPPRPLVEPEGDDQVVPSAVYNVPSDARSEHARKRKQGRDNGPSRSVTSRRW